MNSPNFSSPTNDELAASEGYSTPPAQHNPALRISSSDVLRLIAFLGFAAGLIMTKMQIRATDFHVDMIIYRRGAQAFLENQSLYFQAFMAGDLGLPFIYPPFGALILAPLAKPEWITDEDAAAFVVMLSSLCLLLCLYAVAHTLLKQRNRLVAVTVAAVLWPLGLLTEPVWLNSQFAQINLIIMALVVLDMMPRKRWLPQGWLIGVAAAIKLTPLAMLLFFLVAKKWRAIVAALASALIMTGIGALYAWSRTKEYYLEVLFAMGSGGEFGVNSSYTSNSSIRGALERWWPTEESMVNNQHITSIMWLVFSLASTAFAFVLLRMLLRRGLTVEAVMVNSALMLLISPVSWSHHWVWIPLWIMVVLWHWRVATTRFAKHAFAACAIALSALVLLEPPKWWFGDGIDVWDLEFWKKAVINDYTTAAYLLMAFIFAALIISHRRTATPRQENQ